MSGSGGGGGAGSGGGGRELQCSDIIRSTILNSPNPDVIKTLAPKDVLAVILHSESGGVRVVATANNQIAGSVTFSDLAKLIQCLEEGFEFIAVVNEITGGSCNVQVRPKSQL